MTKYEFKELCLNCKSGVYSRKWYIEKHYPELFAEIIQYDYASSVDKTNWAEMLYNYLNDITTEQLTPCGKKRIFAKLSTGYKMFCSENCSCSIKHRNESSKKTCLEKYGVEFPQQVKEFKEKSRKTCLEKYGANTYVSSNEGRERVKNTMIERYGVDNPWKSEKIRSKCEETMLDRYGAKSPQQIESIKEKTKKTCVERYGVEHPLQSLQVQDKIKKTSLEKYGTEYHIASDEVKGKIKNTLSEKYGVINVSQIEDVKEKIKFTNLKKYGVDHPMKAAIVQNKLKNTFIEKYGVDNPFKYEKFLLKKQQTYLDRYGVDHPMKVKEIIEKSVKTNKETYTKQLFEKYNEISEIKDNTFICKCENINCELYNTCEHIFEIQKGLFHYRKKRDIELCTIKNIPVNKLKEQHEVSYYVSTVYSGEILINTRKILPSGKEIDIYLPELKIGFEFNGDYWHFNPLYYPVSNEEKWIADMQKQYDANVQGISLYTIWENDWLENQEYVKNKIKYIIENKLQKFSPYFYLKTFIEELSLSYTESVFGQFEFDNVTVKYVNAYYYNKNTIDKSWFLKSYKRVIYVYDYEITDIRKFDIIKSEIRYALNLTTNKIFARKCEIREITNKEAKPFLTENSLFGHRNASVTLGLYYNNELVMLYSFGNNYYGQKKDVEVIRVCTKKNIVVVGGSSKCLKYYLEKYRNELNGKNLIFYVDKIHHDGKSLKDNFEFIKHEYGTMNYWRVDYQDETFCGEFGTAFNRSPSKHKEIKELIENDIILPCLTEGVDVYKMKI